MADEIEGEQAIGSIFKTSKTETRHLQSDIVEVLVGPQEARYNVHEGIICDASSLFAKRLQTTLAEAASKVVRLPEDDPETFERILRWTDFAAIDQNLRWNLAGMRKLVKTYALMDKLCVEKLANSIMDVTKTWHQTHGSYATPINDAPHGPMKEYLTAQLAWDIRSGAVWRFREHANDLALFLCSGAPEIHAVMEVIKRSVLANVLGHDLKKPSQDWICKYHKHLDTERCREEAPAKGD